MADREAKVVVVNTDIHQRLKVLAAKKGTTIQTLTEEAIRRLLMSEDEERRRDERDGVPI